MMGLRDCKQFNGGAKTLQTKFIVFLVARQHDFCWIVWMEVTAVFYWRQAWTVIRETSEVFETSEVLFAEITHTPTHLAPSA